MEPSKHSENDDDYNWSEMNESLRKDSECLFGELKQEFAILKYGSRFNSLELLDDIFLTCCAIHNQRKTIAGLDEPWQTADDEDEDLSQEPVDVFRRMADRRRASAGIDDDPRAGMGPGEHEIVQEDIALEDEAMHDVVKQRLITHFKIALEKNEVVWPRRNGVVRNYRPASER
jgi:hypothetical protein